jgi:hypothetical protein
MQNLARTSTRVAKFTVIAMAAAIAQVASAELFVDVGVNSTRVEADIATLAEELTSSSSGVHVGAGLRRELARGSIGARLELDDVDGERLLAVRALDYRRHFSERLSWTAFAGAARLDLETPAHGYYLGAGLELRDIWPSWNLAIDLRLGDKLARDNVLATDPQGGRPDNFYDISGIALYLSRRF